jgi:hypothetical protein
VPGAKARHAFFSPWHKKMARTAQKEFLFEKKFVKMDMH